MTLALLLTAAGVMLAGGVWLARRPVEHRIPADRALLRESAAALQGELSRLDFLYVSHLRVLAESLARGDGLDRVKEAASNLHGVAHVAVLPRRGPRSTSVKLDTLGSPPPEPEFTLNDRRSASPFAFPVPRSRVFGDDEKAPLPTEVDGWLGKPGDAWLAWWKREGDAYAVVFVVRGAAVRTAIDRHLTGMLPPAWAPVRAAGGLDRLEAPDRQVLAGVQNPPDKTPDFIVPLASRLGDWQIVSWDRWETRLAWHLPTLIVAGTLAVGLALLGWVVASAQRRALREVTARVSFVNRVSHELGAPVTNIRLYLELARDSLPADAEESGRRLDVAGEETERLCRLVGNVLTFARGERRSLDLHPQPCRPQEIVTSVMAGFAPALARRGIEVETGPVCNAPAVLDRDAFAQILSNLISNVEKYAACGGWMQVSLQCEDGQLRLTVSDRGPGIPASETARIFLPFERLDSRITEGVTGTGLGLAICRDLAARMAGSISLTPPSSGTGCIFTVTLMLPEAAHSSAL